MKDAERRFHIDVATVSITLIATIIGAVLMLSKLLDTTTIGGLIEKLGSAENTIKWGITILSAFVTGFAVKWSLDYKSDAESKLKEGEGKKFKVAK